MAAMDPRLRIGNSERDRATAELARHYTEGRLDHDEYNERLDAVWTARTQDDLRALFSDLPRPPAVVPVAPVPVRRSGVPLWIRVAPVALLILMLLFWIAE
jgi:hypothetical protein